MEVNLGLYDVKSVHEKCPAFKTGCPYSSITKDNSGIQIAAGKCPEFQDGCPFKNVKTMKDVYEKLAQIPDPQSSEKHMSQLLKAIHEISEPLEETHGDCPVFHTSKGCPFKTVHDSENCLLVDPVESVSYDKGVLDYLAAISISNVKDKCPSFKTECPFIKLVDEDLKTAIGKCEKFQEGCPFKSVITLAELYKLLSTIPHGQDAALKNLFQGMHKIAESEKAVNGDCPVFQGKQGETLCPFKSVRGSNGKHFAMTTY